MAGSFRPCASEARSPFPRLRPSGKRSLRARKSVQCSPFELNRSRSGGRRYALGSLAAAPMTRIEDEGVTHFSSIVGLVDYDLHNYRSWPSLVPNQRAAQLPLATQTNAVVPELNPRNQRRQAATSSTETDRCASFPTVKCCSGAIIGVSPHILGPKLVESSRIPCSSVCIFNLE